MDGDQSFAHLVNTAVNELVSDVRQVFSFKLISDDDFDSLLAIDATFKYSSGGVEIAWHLQGKDDELIFNQTNQFLLVFVSRPKTG